MVGQKKTHLHWFSGIFEPTVDFFALLNQQADKTLEGVTALSKWLKEDGSERCQAVRDLEREADDIKMNVTRQLVSCFVTPFDREDIYELSANLDEVINSSKAVVREMEALSIKSDGTKLAEMSDILVEGCSSLQKSIRYLRTDLKLAAQEALASRKVDTRIGKVYRLAMADLLETDDIKQILRVKEVYKVMLDGAVRIDKVGERLLHAIVKMS